ncbi:MAG: MATE family efflux transporter [Bacteroidales bacterium]|nr:MATE family efflux transporter [Bacteroidales bacterium]
MKDLTQGKIGMGIIHFAVPVILGQVIQQLYTVTDSIIVGRYIGDEALAAVGASFPIIFLLISLIVGISGGTTILISQYYGAKQFDKINQAIQTLTIYLFFSSILIAVLGIVFCESIFRFMNLPEAIIPEATTYLTVYWYGLIGLFGYYGMSAVLRGLGDSKTPLYVLIISSVVNVVLDIIFIAYLDMGIAGAAYATIISQISTFIGLIIFLNRRHEFVKISLWNNAFNMKIFLSSIRIGLPSGIQQAFVALGSIALLKIVSSFDNSDLVAAYVAAIRIDMFATVPAMAIATAVSTFVGQNIGANKLDRVQKGYQFSMLFSVVTSLLLTVCVICFKHTIMGLFTQNTAIIDFGADYLTITAIFYFAYGILFTNNGVLRGAGDTIIPMFITLFALWVVRIPLAYYFSQHWGIVGIWWAIPAGTCFGMLLSYFYYKTGRWKKNVSKYTNFAD